MALVVGENENDVCHSWEEIEANSDILEKQLERLKLEKMKPNPDQMGSSDGSGKIGMTRVTLDSTREESLRTQYVPPEPKMTILMRPKQTNNNTHPSNKTNPKNNVKTVPQTKTLQQREQEYAAARMRILGDVRFEAEEAEAEMEAALSPAEILKLKVAEAIRGDSNPSSSVSNPSPTTNTNANTAKSKKKKSLPNNPDPGSISNDSSDVGQNGQNGLQQNGTVSGPGTGSGNGNRRNKRSREKLKTVNPEPIRDFPVPKTDSDRIIRHPRGPDGSSGFNLQRSS